MESDDRLVIAAEVIVRTSGGGSLANATEPITATNVASVTPEPATLERVTQAFEAFGFAVLRGPVTLTISGPPDLFERVFHTVIKLKKHHQTRDTIAEGELTVPESLVDAVDRVLFTEPPEFFS